MRVVLTAAAMQDMDGISEYIQSLPKIPGIALGRSLQQAIRRMASYPALGQIDSELSTVFKLPIHRRLSGDYIFFYLLNDRQTEIIAVLHGKRDLMRIVSERINWL